MAFFVVSFFSSAALTGAATYLAYRRISRRLDAMDDEIGLAHRTIRDQIDESQALTVNVVKLHGDVQKVAEAFRIITRPLANRVVTR